MNLAFWGIWTIQRQPVAWFSEISSHVHQVDVRISGYVGSKTLFSCSLRYLRRFAVSSLDILTLYNLILWQLEVTWRSQFHAERTKVGSVLSLKPQVQTQTLGQSSGSTRKVDTPKSPGVIVLFSHVFLRHRIPDVTIRRYFRPFNPISLPAVHPTLNRIWPSCNIISLPREIKTGHPYETIYLNTQHYKHLHTFASINEV